MVLDIVRVCSSTLTLSLMALTTLRDEGGGVNMLYERNVNDFGKYDNKGGSSVLTACLIAAVDTALPALFEMSVSASFDTSFLLSISSFSASNSPLNSLNPSLSGTNPLSTVSNLPCVYYQSN